MALHGMKGMLRLGTMVKWMKVAEANIVSFIGVHKSRESTEDVFWQGILVTLYHKIKGFAGNFYHRHQPCTIAGAFS